MSAKNTTKVLIGGKIFTLGGYESEEYLQKVAAYLNNKISDLGSLPGYNRQTADIRNILLSLNIADDYFKARKQAEVFEEDSQTKDRELYDLKNDLIAAQIQLERLKEDYTKLTVEKEELTQENVKLRQKLDDRK
jgi:cell division protein ZapA